MTFWIIVIVLCLLIRRHYNETKEKLRAAERLFGQSSPQSDPGLPEKLDPALPTAIFLVDDHRGVGIHTIMWVLRLFPGHFQNFIFVSAGEVDTQSFDSEATIRTLQNRTQKALCFYTAFCRAHNFKATWRMDYGTDPITVLDTMVQDIMKEFPNSVCFAAKLIFTRDNLFIRFLHNQTGLAMQRRLHLRGQQMVILPMKVD